MSKQHLNQLLINTIQSLLVNNSKVIEELNMKSTRFYQWKRESADVVYSVKKGLVAETLLKVIKVPDDFLFNTPLPIEGNNERMLELYKLGLYSETLLKDVVFLALIKADNVKVK